MAEAKKRVKKPTSWAYGPARYSQADIRNIQALQRGDASPESQTAALKWIIEAACAHGEWAYCPESDRDTNIGLGRQFAGHQIVKMLKLKPSNYDNPRKE